jgi:hypothetical protein
MTETVVVGPVDAPLEIVDPVFEVMAVDPAPTVETIEEVRSRLMAVLTSIV